MKVIRKIFLMLILILVIISTANFLDILIHAQTWVELVKGILLTFVGASAVAYIAEKIGE